MNSLFFTAVWCPACKTMHPIVEALQKEGYAIVIIDADKELQRVREYNIKALPTIVILKDDKEEKRFVGVTKREQLIKYMSKIDYRIW